MAYYLSISSQAHSAKLQRPCTVCLFLQGALRIARDQIADAQNAFSEAEKESAASRKGKAELHEELQSLQQEAKRLTQTVNPRKMALPVCIKSKIQALA